MPSNYNKNIFSRLTFRYSGENYKVCGSSWVTFHPQCVFFVISGSHWLLHQSPSEGNPKLWELIKQLQSVITPWIQPPHLTDRETKERKGWVTCPTWLPAMTSKEPGSDPGFLLPNQHLFCHIMVHIPRHEWKTHSTIVTDKDVVPINDTSGIYTIFFKNIFSYWATSFP